MSDTAWFGLLNVDKPAGRTSREVVDRVAAVVHPARAGHAGTLDPMATGVLVIAVGRATRLVECVQQQPKTYDAEFQFGCVSDTDDITGTIETRAGVAVPSPARVEQALESFVGRIEQVPPAYSAVRVAGQRAYRLARRGKQIQLKPRPVDVHSITLREYEWPRLRLEIECGSGTYIRSLARDLGDRLGCGGLMSRLQRTTIGEFSIADALPWDRLNSHGIRQGLLSAVTAVSHLRQIRLTADQAEDAGHGRRVRLKRPLPCEAAGAERRVALIDPDGRLIALARGEDRGDIVRPCQVFLDAQSS